MTNLARISPMAASTKEEEEEDGGGGEGRGMGRRMEGVEEGEREREWKEGKSHMETVLVQLWPQA